MTDPSPEPEFSADQLGATLERMQRAFLVGVDGMTEVWLIRHADAYRDGPSGPDPGLSRLGREQAQRLGQRLRGLRIDAVYASPLRRAQETARGLAPQVQSDLRLGEARFEIRQGRLELGEPAIGVVERMQAAVDDAVAGHSGGRVLLVTHGLAILQYLGDVLELAPGGFHFFPALASISVVRVADGRRRVGSLGDTAHLEGMVD